VRPQLLSGKGCWSLRKGSDGECGSELAGKNAVKARAAENKRWETGEESALLLKSWTRFRNGP